MDNPASRNDTDKVQKQAWQQKGKYGVHVLQYAFCSVAIEAN